MKDLLIGLVEYVFHVDSDEEITLKKLTISAFKVLIFIAIIALIIWVAIQLKK